MLEAYSIGYFYKVATLIISVPFSTQHVRISESTLPLTKKSKVVLFSVLSSSMAEQSTNARGNNKQPPQSCNAIRVLQCNCTTSTARTAYVHAYTQTNKQAHTDAYERAYALHVCITHVHTDTHIYDSRLGQLL